jgi:hypothetical protein
MRDILTILIVVTHLVVDYDLWSLDRSFDMNTVLEVWLVAGTILSLGNIDGRVEVVVGVVRLAWDVDVDVGVSACILLDRSEAILN